MSRQRGGGECDRAKPSEETHCECVPLALIALLHPSPPCLDDENNYCNDDWGRRRQRGDRVRHRVMIAGDAAMVIVAAAVMPVTHATGAMMIVAVAAAMVIAVAAVVPVAIATGAMMIAAIAAAVVIVAKF